MSLWSMEAHSAQYLQPQLDGHNHYTYITLQKSCSKSERCQKIKTSRQYILKKIYRELF